MDDNYMRGDNMQEQQSVYGPEPVRGWSWGAFIFSLPFGLGNRAYLTLLVLVPLLNFVWMFVCGAKGHEWAQLVHTTLSKNSMQPWEVGIGPVRFAFSSSSAFWLYISFLSFPALPWRQVPCAATTDSKKEGGYQRW